MAKVNFYQVDGLWHWEGEDKYEDYCSEDGFESKRDCVNDAIAFLDSVEEAEEVCDED